MPIKVKVTVGGLLCKPLGKTEVEQTLADGATVRELLTSLGYSKEHIPRIMASVNGTIRKPDFNLSDGDDVKLSILVGGG